MLLFKRKVSSVAAAIVFFIGSNFASALTIYYEYVHKAGSDKDAHYQRMKIPELLVKKLNARDTLFRSSVELVCDEEQEEALKGHVGCYHRCFECLRDFLTINTKYENATLFCHNCGYSDTGLFKAQSVEDSQSQQLLALSMVALRLDIKPRALQVVKVRSS